MAKFAEEQLQRLRSSGLFVSDPYPSDHVYGDGVLVAKPVSTAGNSIAGYKSGYSNLNDLDIEVDAPFVFLVPSEDAWYVLAQDFVPGPGPGDFVDEWKTAAEAVDDILNFYFGDPARMEAKAKARRKTLA